MTDSDLMTFGKYKGTAMANVPATYLRWVKENVQKNSITAPVIKYIWDNWDAIKLELKKEEDANQST